ncbi:OLC1v1013752C1 [Oldenlandia corymbosa var. corymbosa]|uniref:OLC1v1013752C1 n=1 Tax=Oldenlandia corymbosa var. corymbosa TaxID=529605 RepID=A0AAV1DZI0_OLDCO|nr:OLC1v1013752C1 [Oldenlandia corymbosa var. corymbosa]
MGIVSSLLSTDELPQLSGASPDDEPEPFSRFGKDYKMNFAGRFPGYGRGQPYRPSEDLIVPQPEYYPHVAVGGRVLNPDSIRPLPGSQSFRGPILARQKPIIHINPCLVAIISGGKAEDCGELRRDLQNKCSNYESKERRRIPLMVALESMLDTLSSRGEVGMIAGWDEEEKGPAVFRVDGMGGLLYGDILACGSGFRLVYAYLQVRFQIATKLARTAICWTAVNARDGEAFGSGYYVGRHGLDRVFSDVPVEKYVRDYGLPLPVKKGVLLYMA